MNQQAVQEYRNQFRENQIGPRYSGRGHLALTTLVSVMVIALSLYSLENVQVLDWLAIPLVLCLANLVEYMAHKGPMHRKTRFIEVIFRRHAVEHHSFFTEDQMEFDEERDFSAVLFPPVMLLFFFGGIATPLGALSYFLFGANIAGLFVFTVTFYFLNYEIMHFLYHVNEDAWTSRLPFMKFLRRHHTIHHDRALMSRYNFNITYPICDRLFGTTYREKDGGR